MSFVLTTDWDGFLDECKRRWPDGARVFLDQVGSQIHVSAVDLDKGVLVRTSVGSGMAKLTKSLSENGHSVRRGRWSATDQGVESGEFWIAAVAYESSGSRPGLWVDVFPTQPTPSDVQAAMLAEFIAEGTLDQVDADELARRAKPNTVILGPDDVAGFVAAKLRGPEND